MFESMAFSVAPCVCARVCESELNFQLAFGLIVSYDGLTRHIYIQTGDKLNN